MDNLICNSISCDKGTKDLYGMLNDVLQDYMALYMASEIFSLIYQPFMYQSVFNNHRNMWTHFLSLLNTKHAESVGISRKWLSYIVVDIIAADDLVTQQVKIHDFNTLAPGRSGYDFKNAVVSLVEFNGIFRSSDDNALR